MKSKVDPIYIRSVPSTFSWDTGDFSIPPTNIVPTVSSNGVPIYIGYAPLTEVLLNIRPQYFDISNPYFVRSVNFGDYYNSSTNIINLSGLSDVRVNHSYIMPGLYSIALSEAEYYVVNSYVWDETTVLQNPNLVWPEYTGVQATTIEGNTIVPNVTAQITETTVNFLLSVVEIFPTAYLSSSIPLSPEDIVFPLTVRITPRYTQSGSFPIEKIVWDLGDGTPLITKRRWDTNTSYPFVTSGALSADLLDPRNFDIIHTYTKQSVDQYSFYPSITAYASCTNSSDACSITIGPIASVSQSPSDRKLEILQTELNEDGIVLLGQVGNDIGVWKTS